MINNSQKRTLPKGEAAKRKLIKSYKDSAKLRNLEFKLSDEDLVNFFTQQCCICKVQYYSTSMTYHKESGGYAYNGIDRIDNDIGYIKENCRTMCKLCNYAKKTLKEDKFQEWLKRIRENS